MLRPIASIRYFVRFFKLVIHAGVVWRILPEMAEPEPLQSWAEQINGTPLWPELQYLERERLRLTGKPVPWKKS